MSSPRVISWLPINNTLIADSQSTTAAGNLALNSKVPTQPKGAFIYDKVIRKIRLTTTGNESGTQYTITGIGSPVDGNGNPTQPVSLITEGPFAGPTNVLPKNSDNIYQQIISIFANAAVGNISVGSGASGITDFVFLDHNTVFGAANCSIQFLNRATISAIGYNSLNKPQVPDINFGNLVTSPFLATQFIASTFANTFQQIPTPCSVVWLSISNTTTDSLNFTVLQQGVYP